VLAAIIMKHHLRFGIRNGALRAATWNISSPDSTSDIYISCRELKGFIKVSLHETGSWHLGYSDKAFDKYFKSDESSEKDKYIEIWPRPNVIAEGMTLAFRIVTPYSATSTPVEDTLKDIIWIPNCAIGYATEIDIFITRLRDDPQNWPGKNRMATKLVGSYNLQSNETVSVVYWQIPIPHLSPIANKPFNFLKGASERDLKNRNLRAIVFADEKDGSRTIFDCAIENNRS